MNRILAGLVAGTASIFLMLASLAVTTGSASAQTNSPANGLPNCQDSRHDAEYSFTSLDLWPTAAPLCVCSNNASGCPAITVQTCKTYTWSRLKTVVPGQQVCVYNLGQTNHPAWQNDGHTRAYWAQRITGPTAPDSLPNCQDSRHDVEYSFTDIGVWPTAALLCVCSNNASGCPAITVQTCKTYAWSRLKTVAPGQQVCVYNLGQTNHPAWQNDGHARAYWAQRITGPTVPDSLPDCNFDASAQGTFSDPAMSPNAEILCVCDPSSSAGCSVQTSCPNTDTPLYRRPTSVQGASVCVYSFGQVNHPAWQNNGQRRAYWAQPMAQRVKPPSFTMDCNSVAGRGFAVSQVSVHRAGATSPRAGSYAIPGATYAIGPLRQYGTANVADRAFIDSFSLNGPRGQNVCRIDLTVQGARGDGNDFLKVFAPNSNGAILANNQWQNGSILGGRSINRPQPWSYSLAIEGTGTMAPALAAAMAGPVKQLDLVVMDDSSVTSTNLVYHVY